MVRVHFYFLILLEFYSGEDGALSGASRDGGYAEYVTLRSEAVVPVPEDMDPAEIAPLLCAGVSTFRAFSI